MRTVNPKRSLWALGTLLGREQVRGLGGTVLVLVAACVVSTLVLCAAGLRDG